MIYREFWENGYRVFGLYGRAPSGKCECGWGDCPEASLMKHPRIHNWQNTPPWSEEQLEVMEMSGQLDTGYGVLCRGLLVIDVDARNGGMASYEKLLDRFPDVAGSGLVVQTGSGSGSKHLYFRAPEGVPLVTMLKEYPGIDFKSSGYVVGPGSLHASGNKYTWIGEPADIGDAPPELIEALRKPERHRTEYNGGTIDVSHAEIADMLAHVNPDCEYDTWIRMGMAVHEATEGTGFALWDDWSANGSKYPDNKHALESHWNSFGRSANPVTIGTLIHHASEGGWVAPVTFSDGEHPAAAITRSEPDTDADGKMPLDIAGVDLTQPPGFTGEVASWFESRNRRSRALLSAMGAIMGIGGISMRYTDDIHGDTTTNLFVFGVAGSGTGKDNVQASMGEVFRAAGMSAAVHGAIKSEQEIVRNLIEHQAAIYSIDEFGMTLQKLQNASRRGGAAYLEGVVGTLMSAYSKTNGYMGLSGDVRRQSRADIQKEIAAINKRADQGYSDESESSERRDKVRLESLQRAIEHLDIGLHRPFLSLAGYTTPETFNSLVDFDMAANGFIGRAIIFNERDTVPRIRQDYNPQPMPENMAARLSQIHSAGRFDVLGGGRIEHHGDRIRIPTEPDARAALDRIAPWFDDMAASMADTSGLEALYMRAFEKVAKVSLILAVPGGLRTLEHVRYAFALAYRDVEAKARLVVENRTERHESGNALMAKITNLCDGEAGQTMGVIVNRCRPTSKDDVQKAVKKMLEAGILQEKKVKGANGKTSTRLTYIDRNIPAG